MFLEGDALQRLIRPMKITYQNVLRSFSRLHYLRIENSLICFAYKLAGLQTIPHRQLNRNKIFCEIETYIEINVVFS